MKLGVDEEKEERSQAQEASSSVDDVIVNCGVQQGVGEGRGTASQQPSLHVLSVL